MSTPILPPAAGTLDGLRCAADLQDHRSAENEWQSESLEMNGLINIPCLGASLSLEEIYEGIL